jgi:iron complex transport system substrate-binding protein
MQFYIIILLYFLAILTGCNNPESNYGSGNMYANGFTINEESGISKLTVRNPWEKARNIEIDYYLIPKDADVPSSLTGKNIIRTPVEKIICLSTTHLAFLDALGEIHKVAGISGSSYVSNPFVRNRVNNAEIVDVGYGQNLNYEEIISRRPDVVMVYGVDSEITGFLNKFRDLGIPAILNAEYLEASPLGKAEWIKFVGAMFDKSDMADSLFSAIEANYLRLSGIANKETLKPKVMLGLPYRDSWWVPGGNSYMAKLIADAGGEYIGKENTSHESFVISFEEALMWAEKADVWINLNMVSSKSEILDIDNRFGKFKVFRQGKIYNNNLRTTDFGGNDFWESGVVAPDHLLSDLIKIFHPQLLPSDYVLKYYQEIK